MKDKLLRKLLLKQDILRVIATPGPPWDRIRMAGRSIDAAYRTPQDLIVNLSAAVAKLAKDRDLLLKHLGLKLIDLNAVPPKRVIRKRKKNEVDDPVGPQLTTWI